MQGQNLLIFHVGSFWSEIAEYLWIVRHLWKNNKKGNSPLKSLFIGIASFFLRPKLKTGKN